MSKGKSYANSGSTRNKLLNVPSRAPNIKQLSTSGELRIANPVQKLNLEPKLRNQKSALKTQTTTENRNRKLKNQRQSAALIYGDSPAHGAPFVHTARTIGHWNRRNTKREDDARACEELTDAKPAEDDVHSHGHTHNAMASFGNGTCFEILAPDTIQGNGS